MAADAATMRAIAVRPGVADSLHGRDVRRPRVDDVANGRGVLVRVLRVGLDGTDHDIIKAEYGQAPPGATTSSSSATRTSARSPT
jgi:threonine dehydrogenase-like Zn-dependent dehydrogenase